MNFTHIECIFLCKLNNVMKQAMHVSIVMKLKCGLHTVFQCECTTTSHEKQNAMYICSCIPLLI